MCSSTESEKGQRKTYSEWVTMMEKYGFVPSNPSIKKSQKNTTCDFGDFMKLCGGSFNMLDNYETQDLPVPRPSCEYCKKEEKEGEKLKSCTRCQEKYCSKECQRKDWKVHKKTCDIIATQLS